MRTNIFVVIALVAAIRVDAATINVVPETCFFAFPVTKGRACNHPPGYPVLDRLCYFLDHLSTELCTPPEPGVINVFLQVRLSENRAWVVAQLADPHIRITDVTVARVGANADEATLDHWVRMAVRKIRRRYPPLGMAI